MDKQREEFYKAYPRHEGILELYDAGSLQYLDAFGAVRDFMVLQAAQAAMQPEIVQLAKDNLSLMAQHADATKRIAELEERIRVADAEEPVLWMFTVDGRYYTAKSKAHADSMLRHPDTYLYPDKPEDFPLSPLYLHAQIPAEVELKAKIAELEAIIKASQEQEPVEIECPEYHEQGMGRGLEDRCITDRYEAMRYGWDCAIEVMMFGGILPEPRYAAPVIKEQP